MSIGCSVDRTVDDTPPDAGVIEDKKCGPDRPCPAHLRCVQDACVRDYGPCCSDDDCQDDTRCQPDGGDGGSCGVCVPYKSGEFDPMCRGGGFSPSEFAAPIISCSWPKGGTAPAGTYVMSTPVIADVDGDKQPEIIFVAQVDTLSTPAHLVAISGRDCRQLYDVAVGIKNYTQLAVADLNRDGKLEIAALLDNGSFTGGRPVALFDGATGTRLATSTESYKLTDIGNDCSGVAIADLEGDGTPEIIVAGMALRWDEAAKSLVAKFNQSVSGAVYGSLTIASDLDGDGIMELVAGAQVLDGRSGADKTPGVMAGLGRGGYPAVADMNRDGAPDIVLVQSHDSFNRVSVIDVKNNKFLLPPTDYSGDKGGAPTVADFDGDGAPDIGFAGQSQYFVLSLDCLQSPKPAKCTGTAAGVLWTSSVKDSSGATASSVFDFNGDGRAEVVYRDECWLRVYNGADGKVLFTSPITSATALEMPIVADVDADGHADLVVPSDSHWPDTYCNDQNPEPHTGAMHTGHTTGLFVLRDPMNRWVSSRTLWNQHTYHITNVSDDGTIPHLEPPNHKTYNNFRQNAPGKLSSGAPAPDLTASASSMQDGGTCQISERLYAQICNRGAGAAPIVPGTFYRMDPRLGMLSPICTAQTAMPLNPGSCATVSCDWMSPPPGATDLWFRANDDGHGKPPTLECKTKNNLAFLPAVGCASTPG